MKERIHQRFRFQRDRTIVCLHQTFLGRRGRGERQSLWNICCLREVENNSMYQQSNDCFMISIEIVINKNCCVWSLILVRRPIFSPVINHFYQPHGNCHCSNLSLILSDWTINICYWHWKLSKPAKMYYKTLQFHPNFQKLFSKGSNFCRCPTLSGCLCGAESSPLTLEVLTSMDPSLRWVSLTSLS